MTSDKFFLFRVEFGWWCVRSKIINPFIFLSVILLLAVIVVVLSYNGIVADSDKDGIPDAVEDAFDDLKDEIKKKIKKSKES